MQKIAFSFSIIIVLASCASDNPEKPEQVTAKIVPAALPVLSLRSALTDLTGFTLGNDGLSKVKKVGVRICAAKMRYGDQKNAKIAQLYCYNQAAQQDAVKKFWVNFTSPVKGHKAWKISLSLSGAEALKSEDLISHLTASFGTPKVVNKPISFSWTEGDVHLRLVEDAYGLQLELWDRSLRRVL